MATPLFFVDLDALKRAVRASGIPATHDAHSILEICVDSANVTMYDRLGSTRMGELLAGLPVVDPATTDAQRAVMRARVVERDLVLMEMLIRLPFASKDGSAAMQEWYDKESPFRDFNSDQRRDLLGRLEQSIDAALSVLDTTGAQPHGFAGAVLRNQSHRGLPGIFPVDSSGNLLAPRLGYSLL